MTTAVRLRPENRTLRSEGWLRACWIVATLLPPAVILALICTRGVNVPYHDEWSLVPFILKANAGQVTMSDVFAQHNEHRIASIRLLLLALLPLTHFNVVANMLAAFAMALAALLLFWRSAQRTVGNANHVPLLMLPISMLMFSVVQHEAWLYSLPAMQWQFATLCAAATVWAMARWPASLRALAVAGCCAVVSTYALASGFVLWMAAVAGLMVPEAGVNRRWSILGAGALVTVLLAWALIAGYQAPPQIPGPVSAISMPGSTARFVAQYFGVPFALFTESHSRIAAIGAIGLFCSIATALLAWRISAIPRAAVAPWLALWLYALGVGVVTGIGRAGLSPNAALVRRYPAAAALLWIATIVVGYLAWTNVCQQLTAMRKRLLTAAVVVALCLAAAGYVTNYRWAYRELIRRQQNTEVARDELLLFKTAAPVVFQYLYPPDPAIVPTYSELLEKAALGPFSGSDPR